MENSWAPSSTTSAAPHGSLRATTESIALLRRRRNLGSSKQLRLPTEIWCDVWGWLPFVACIAVTHTCHRWRLMALACPSMWTRPQFYTSVTSFVFQRLLRGSYPGGHLPSWDASPYPPETTNMSCAREILERSGNMPLHIFLDVVPLHASHPDIKYLARVLVRHSQRIASITARSADLSAVRVFLQQIQNLPVTRHIIVERLETGAEDSFPAPRMFLPPDITLPNLEVVDLGPGYLWPVGGVEYLNLRRLSLTPSQDLRSELTTALRACPQLQALSIDLAGFHAPDDSAPEDSAPSLSTGEVSSLRSLAAKIRAVRIVNLPVLCDTWALTLFGLSSRREIVIDGKECLSVEACGEIFRDLGAGVALSVLRRDGRVSVEGTDLAERGRRVSCTESFSARRSRDAMTRAICGKYVDWRSVVKLTVSASHWFHCVDAIPGAPAVICLKVVIEKGKMFDEVPLPWTPDSTPQKFPALRRLDVVGRDGLIKMSATDIAAVVHTLNLNLPLAALYVDHRMFVGAREPLYKLAQRVAARVYQAV
ncbi:hypothetical protein AURDEDRAFT_165883 [Auricularia subglabra TFB-10046 SS5]|nr:hypothetical protein AURDEDRAFT_165883 [Auricularia subglabra TFB-10046 SS5]